jgi:signal peptidase I
MAAHMVPWKAHAALIAVAAGISCVVLGWLAVLGFLVLRENVAEADFTVMMEGRSMEDTISSGALLAVNEYESHPVERFDIVWFIPPNEPPDASNRRFVKRVVGMPGDVVLVREGRVLINDAPLNEPYVNEPVTYEYGPATVPADHLFVLGDNRNNSSDSHSWGMLPAENVLGRIVLISPPHER